MSGSVRAQRDSADYITVGFGHSLVLHERAQAAAVSSGPRALCDPRWGSETAVGA